MHLLCCDVYYNQQQPSHERKTISKVNRFWKEIFCATCVCVRAWVLCVTHISMAQHNNDSALSQLASSFHRRNKTHTTSRKNTMRMHYLCGEWVELHSSAFVAPFDIIHSTIENHRISDDQLKCNSAQPTNYPSQQSSAVNTYCAKLQIHFILFSSQNNAA